MKDVSESRRAGLLAVMAGGLMVITELVMWPTVDPMDHVTTSLDPVYQASGVAYFLAFCLLLLALVAVHRVQADEAGAFGRVGLGAALVGTMFLGGDLWFETFVVPWIAAEAPQVLDIEPSGLLPIGAISSYLLFAVGWALFGLASFRAGVFPRAISAGIVVGGLLGFQALLPPFGVPLGLALAVLGVWLLRARVPAAGPVGTSPAA